MDRKWLGCAYVLLVLNVFVPTAAISANDIQLMQEVPTLGNASEVNSPVDAKNLSDTRSLPEAKNTAAPVSSQHMTLYGSARKNDGLSDTKPTTSQSLQAETTVTDKASSTSLRAIAEQKLANGTELTAEEYRSLGAGCVGYESVRTFFKKIGKVTVVYAGSPADKAGIRVGDKIVCPDGETDEQAKSDPTQPLWSVTCGLAGTTADITLLRHNHSMTITLTRMNIEDIQDDAARHSWEKMLRNFGYPTDGTFTKKTQHELESSGTDE